MMGLKESCNLFQINNIDEIDKKTLKKKYHKMCLIYHPDKSKEHSNQFVKMKKCYDTLNTYIDNNERREECLVKPTPDNIYETLISLISVENIDYVTKLIDSYKIYMNNVPEIITLNVSLKQVFGKCVYLNDDHYIPLWHNVVHRFSVREQKHIIYAIKIINIPDNVRVLKNNDVVIQMPKSGVKQNAFNLVCVCEHTEFDVYITSCEYEQSYVLLKNKGIPKTNMNDIFDSSHISNIHLHLI